MKTAVRTSRRTKERIPGRGISSAVQNDQIAARPPLPSSSSLLEKFSEVATTRRCNQ